MLSFFSIKYAVVSIITFKPLKFNILLYMNIVSFQLSYVGKNHKKYLYRYSFYKDIISNRLLPDICLVRRSHFVIITKITGDNKQMQLNYFQFCYKLPGYNMGLFKTLHINFLHSYIRKISKTIHSNKYLHICCACSTLKGSEIFKPLELEKALKIGLFKTPTFLEMYGTPRDLLPSIRSGEIHNASYSVMGQHCLVDGGSPAIYILVTILH